MWLVLFRIASNQFFYPKPRNSLQLRRHLPHRLFRPCWLLLRLNRRRLRRCSSRVFLSGKGCKLWVILNPAVGTGWMQRKPVQSPSSRFSRMKMQQHALIVRCQLFVKVNSNFSLFSKRSVYSMLSVRNGSKCNLEYRKRWSG